MGNVEGPLAGITVFDIGRFVAGPVTATVLGEFGARVVKFERPRSGDELRALGPPIADGSAWWALEGRNKENVTLDLGQPDGRDLFRSLVRHADVVVENFRPGTLERWGLDYTNLTATNPQLILLRTSGYGSSGPYRLLPGLNTAGEALGGLRYIMGEPGEPPTRPGVALADYTAAMLGAVGVLVALYERDRPGGSKRGQWIDNTLYEAVMRIMEWTFVAYDQNGVVRERIGAGSAGTVPARAYLSRDQRWVGISAASDDLFRRLADAMRRPELGSDRRFATNQDRVAHRREIDRLIEDWAATLDAKQIVETLRAAQVPVNEVCSVADIFDDPHVAARRSLVTTQLSDGRPVVMQGVVPRLSRTPGEVRWAGRPLGADTRKVFGEWVTTETIDDLEQRGII